MLNHHEQQQQQQQQQQFHVAPPSQYVASYLHPQPMQNSVVPTITIPQPQYVQNENNMMASNYNMLQPQQLNNTNNIQQTKKVTINQMRSQKLVKIEEQESPKPASFKNSDGNISGIHMEEDNINDDGSNEWKSGAYNKKLKLVKKIEKRQIKIDKYTTKMKSNRDKLESNKDKILRQLEFDKQSILKMLKMAEDQINQQYNAQKVPLDESLSYLSERMEYFSELMVNFQNF